MSRLPESIANIVELVGLDGALALVNAFGGLILPVPKGIREEDGNTREKLIEILGEPAALRFMATYGGERLTIARCAAALRDERDRQIIESYSRGESVAELVRRHQLTERQIRTILKRTPGEGFGYNAGGKPQDERQGLLF